MKQKDYVVIDLEMTGLSAKRDKIIEIGAVRVRDGKVTETFETFVNPKCPIPERVTELTGITNEMVKDAMAEDDALKKLFAFLGEDVLVGQNVGFDYSFLKQWAVNKKYPFEKKACDTLKIARKLLPAEQPKNLEALCAYFHIERRRTHRALDDAMETAQVFEKLKEITEEDSMFEPKPLVYRAKRQTPATPRQLQSLKEYRIRHNITDEINWETLTGNEASRMMDRYYSIYGRG
uniref:3'-5' exonuclease n=1 Tax=Agathobacter sp. TaxID=2021311 RepID=UPI00405790F5